MLTPPTDPVSDDPGGYHAPQYSDGLQRHLQASEPRLRESPTPTSSGLVAKQANLTYPRSASGQNPSPNQTRPASLETSDRSMPRGLLDSSYKLRDNPNKFFKFGKVFLSLWVEPSGVHSRNGRADSESSTNEDEFPVAFGERAFAKIRRFIVVRPMMQASICVAISTHSGEGIARLPGMPFKHAIVHTGRLPPLPLPGEAEAEFLTSIRVDSDVPGQSLHPASRVDFGKLYTVEHNMKVKPYGVVNQYSMVALAENFALVLDAKQLDAKISRSGHHPGSTNKAVGTAKESVKMVSASDLKTLTSKIPTPSLLIEKTGMSVPLAGKGAATVRHTGGIDLPGGEGNKATEKVHVIDGHSPLSLHDRMPSGHFSHLESRY